MDRTWVLVSGVAILPRHYGELRVFRTTLQGGPSIRVPQRIELPIG